MPLFNLFRDEKRRLTIDQLLKNPAGIGSAYLARRDKIITDLNLRYGKLLDKRRKDFKVTVLQGKKGKYYIHISIPSETYDKLKYDVLLEAFPADKDVLNFEKIDQYSIHLFSNAPNFTFTYAYVLHHNKLLIDVMVKNNKHNRKALTVPPKVRNPIEQFGFEKSVYFACKYLKDEGYLVKTKLESKMITGDFNSIKFFKAILSDNEKLSQYNNYKKEELKKKAREKKKEQAKKKSEESNSNRIESTKSTSRNIGNKSVSNVTSKTKTNNKRLGTKSATKSATVSTKSGTRSGIKPKK